jgi:hypothetical protein
MNRVDYDSRPVIMSAYVPFSTMEKERTATTMLRNGRNTVLSTSCRAGTTGGKEANRCSRRWLNLLCAWQRCTPDFYPETVDVGTKRTNGTSKSELDLPEDHVDRKCEWPCSQAPWFVLLSLVLPVLQIPDSSSTRNRATNTTSSNRDHRRGISS